MPLVLLLAACGGGGGGGGGGPVATAPSPPSFPSKKNAGDGSKDAGKDNTGESSKDSEKKKDEPLSKSNPPVTDEEEIDAPNPGEPKSASAVSGSLYDGPIQGAAVYVDVNRNRQVDSEDHLIDDATDRDGNFEGEIPDRLKGLPLIADNRGAEHRIDEDVDLPDFFVAPAGSGVISPLTHIIQLNIVREPVIRKHVLFGQFLPLSDNPHVIEDTSQGQGRYVFYGHIWNFLRDLTTILKQGETANWSSDRIEREVRNLLEK